MFKLLFWSYVFAAVVNSCYFATALYLSYCEDLRDRDENEANDTCYYPSLRVGDIGEAFFVSFVPIVNYFSTFDLGCKLLDYIGGKFPEFLDTPLVKPRK